MTDLKRRIIDLPDGRYWALYGQNGVVEFNIQEFAEYGTRDLDSHVFVGMHSPRPHEHAEDSPHTCEFLGGPCFVEMSDSGAVFIATEWENADFDDEVIWRWLTEFYADGIPSA